MALTVGTAQPQGTLQMGTVSPGTRAGQVYWTGQDGNIWLRETNGRITNLGTPQQAKVWGLGLNGAKEIGDPVANKTPSNTNLNGGSGAPAKVLDTAQLGSLDSLIASLGTDRNDMVRKASLTRDAALTGKTREKEREEGKYSGKKLSTLQDFSGAKTDTDLNTRNTLENLVSSLSTLGLGGSRALTRQILDAANMSNRKANATQATNNQGLDSAWNEYSVGNSDDMKKIQDQYGYEAGEAEKNYLKQKQTALYKKADVYNAADGQKAGRAAVMTEGDSLNGLISKATFMNPSYTGEAKAMATPELGSYTQDIAKYDTTNIGAGGLSPADAGAPAGNLAVKAIAVNDKDLGIKKKTEGDLGYGA